MDKKKVLEIIKKYPSRFTDEICKNHKLFYEYILNNFNGDKFSEKLYQYVYSDSGICKLKGCENKPPFLSFNRGYQSFCSAKCRNEYWKQQSKEERICKVCGNSFIEYKSKKREMCGNECRRIWNKKISNSENRKNKIKETMKSKYGGIGFGSSLQDKIRNTMVEKYGNLYYNNRDKCNETKKKRYNDKTYNNRKKAKETIVKRYGSRSVLIEMGAIGRKKATFYRIKDKLKNDVEFLFDIEDFDGVGYYDKKYKFQCKKCNNIFEDSIYSAKIPRCLICHPPNQPTSKYEKEIVEYLKTIYNGDIIKNDKKVLNGKELDIYIPDKKIAIEFDGLYWHSDIAGNKDKKYHLNKTIECENKEIQLIHIFEDEWINKEDIVKSKLKNILSLSEKSIYGRECEVREIDTKTKNIFLEEYHIQGGDKSNVKLGLFYNTSLVGVMTFGNRRLALGKRKSEESEYELIRFATSTNVAGGASKLFFHFVKNYSPKKIISYADRRWSFSKNVVYDKMGFVKVNNGKPNYWYIGNTFDRIHRFNFRKNVLNEKLEKFDSNLTEWENMQMNGYDRIWDCGHLVYEWNF